jgi:threonine-phosphate decarboxylase
VGYVLAEPSFVATCQSRKPEWSLNGLAASALPDLLVALDLADCVRRTRALRDQLRALLEGHGIVVHPSDANWLLVVYPGLRAALAPKGIVVRDCASFGLEGFARIAVPNEAGLARLADALETLGRE